MSTWTLKHKNVPVADLAFDGSYLVRILGVHNGEHAPVGCRNLMGRIDAGLLRDWWNGRMVPVKRMPREMGISNWDWSQLSYGCNLSDHYWICPEGSGLKYGDVNFYENDFGDAAFGSVVEPYVSPDASSNGNLVKSWCVRDGKRILRKRGTGLYANEVCNERIGSELCRILGVSHVAYGTGTLSGHPVSACACMTDIGSEIVTAHQIGMEGGRVSRGPGDDIRFYIGFGLEHGVGNIREEIGNMVLVDYLLRNSDRHWSNFGLLRDPDMLQYVGTVPLFDFGNNLWHDDLQVPGRDIRSRFSGKSLWEDVCDYGNIRRADLSKLCRYLGIVSETYRAGNLPRSFRLKVLDGVERRVERLEAKYGLSRNLEREVEDYGYY